MDIIAYRMCRIVTLYLLRGWISCIIAKYSYFWFWDAICQVFVRLTWCSTKNLVLVHCKAFSVDRKFPCPALNAFVWNHCDHRDKEWKCFPWPFLCFSKHQFFRRCHYLHLLIPLKYWFYDCALHLHCIPMTVRGCWVSVSLLTDMHSHAYVKS